VSLSHAMENIFGEIRAGRMDMSTDLVDAMLMANDCLRNMIGDVMNSEDVDISSYVTQLTDILNGKSAPVEKAPPAKAATAKKKATGSKASAKEKTASVAPPVEEEKSVERVASVPEAISTIVDESVYHLSQLGQASQMREKLTFELNRGCRLFKLKRLLYADLVEKGIHLASFLSDLSSMGTVIDCQMVQMLDEETPSDVHLEILYTSVLERDFLPSLFSEPAEALIELSVVQEDTPPLTLQIEEQEELDEQEEQEDEPEAIVAPVVASHIEIANVDPIPAAVREGEKDKQKSAVPAEDSIRVNVTLLNNLLYMSSEMVLARNQLLRTMEKHRKGIPGIDEIFQNINHITTNLQEKIMQTRMQPVSNVFSKFPRIVRELSKKLNKDIQLELEGTEVELDKSIIEALGDPLTHLVRNAVDHGIEMPEDRLRSEKPRGGTVYLKAYHESGYVNIDVIDDGKGIDAEIIRNKACEKGFITRADAAMMGEQESLQLLFKPGFSTASAITDISGRGVGMDVVKTNVEKMGGKIEIFTVLGRGATFRLLLPLTLAIIPSLIVEAEQQKFVLPQINVQEIVRIKASDSARKIEYINNSEVLRLRGKLLPIVRLADVLGLDRKFVDPETGALKPDKRKLLFDARRQTATAQVEQGVNDRRGYRLTNIVRILVIKIGSRRLGLSVDAIHGSEEILVKTLPVHIKECKNYSGVTILGDGKAAMILDPSGIIESANLRYIDGQDDLKNRGSASEAEKMREHQNLLLFKCSGSEMLALEMAMVSRVEEISTEEIEVVGTQEYIQFRGEPLRIIRPEQYLPLTKRTISEPQSKYFVIIPKLVKHPMGILIEKMNDTVQTSINITQDSGITAKGIIGSAIINERIVIILNLYELFEIVDPERYKFEPKHKNTSPLKILLVEDTPFFQKVEKDYLETSGYSVVLAENGKEAFKILQKEQFDAVVSDIVMPEMNGLELIKRIRANNQLAGLPVIAVTSLTGEQQKKEGMAAGFDAYEFKLDRAKLLETLEQTLLKKRVLA
jgi:two-component system, chemotaxis family, sensor kinase CheA